MNTIDALAVDALYAGESCWFVKDWHVIERTDHTITIHLQITDALFVQAFFSERSRRLSFALIGPVGRLYGRDREYGSWHRHPFEKPSSHEPTPEGMSPHPLIQFMAEVEEILLANGLI